MNQAFPPLRESWQTDELPVWNAFVRRFPAAQQWQAWGEAVLREMLLRPAGSAGHLQWTDVTGRLPAGELEFHQTEIWLRSGEDSPLAEQLPASFQACIVKRDDAFYLQNQVGRIATILNREKLLQASERPLNDGDQLQVFPFELTFHTRLQWEPDAAVRLSFADALPCAWEEFAADASVGCQTYALRLQPSNQFAGLEIPLFLQQQLTAALLAPFGVREGGALPLAADVGLLEYVILSVLSEANLTLGDTHTIELQPAPFACPLATRGLMTRLTIHTTSCAGTMRLFAPFALLEACTALSLPSIEVAAAPDIPVQRVISAGWQELSVREFLALEPQDIVLLEPDTAAVMFTGLDWQHRLSLLTESPLTMMIEEPFSDADLELPDLAESVSVEADATITNAGPDPDDIPVRLQVILDDTEISYAEARALVPGALLELARDFAGSVRIALNGRVVGDGELVNIEGRVGVKVVRWTR